MHPLNQPALFDVLGWSLLNSLWQMSLMWLLYVIITTACGKIISANARHNIALGFLGTGSAWFAFSLTANYFSNDLSQQAIITTNIFSGNQVSFFASTKQFINNLLPYCSIAYLMALGFLIARYLKYYFSSQHLKQTGLHKAPAELRIFIEDIAARVGMRKNVKLWLSSAIQSPMTIGFLKPVILIPLATINHLSSQQMEAVLLHELAHIRRNDYLLNLMVTLTEIIFFFNPFSLLLIHAIKKERENSCDDLVVQFRYDRCAYASALLSLEKARHTQKLAMAAVGKSNKLLLQRVLRITEQKNAASNNSPKFILFILIAITAAFTALVQPQNIVAKIINSNKSKAPSAKHAELQQINYVTAGFINKKSEKVSLAAKKKIVMNIISDNKPANENDIDLVSNNEQEDVDNSENLSQAVAAEPREYSIVQPATAAVPENISIYNYPYVPSASFSYTEIEDTSAPKIFHSQTGAEKDAKLSMEKTLKAMSAIDWKKIEKGISISGKDLDIAKLQNEIRKSLREVDWDKINQSVNSAADESDEKRMRLDLQVQLETLKNLKYNDYQKTLQLKQQILKQQFKLQQATIKKQQDLMKQVEDMRKKIKIVYI